MSFSCPHCSQAIGDAIPKHRFDEINAELKAAKTRMDEVSKTAGISEKLAGEVQQLRDALASRDATHSREVAFLGAGLADPSVREVFGLHFDRQRSQDGGKSDPAEWLAHIQSAPEHMPAVLSALLPGKAPQAPQPAQGQTRGAWLPQPTQSNVKAPPTAGPTFTAAQIASMPLSDFAKSYEAIVASSPDLRAQFSPSLPWAKTTSGS